MKKRLFIILSIICIALLVSCNDNTPSPLPSTTTDNSVTHVGKIPAEFEKIVAEDLFADVVAYSDRVLSYVKTDDSLRLTMYDFYGNIISHHEAPIDKGDYPSTFSATSDGGFIFAIQKDSSFLADEGRWYSASRIIKCDARGNLMWDIILDDPDKTNDYCFILEDTTGYYLIGTTQDYRRMDGGGFVLTKDDIRILRLDKNGSILETKSIGSQGYDSISYAEINNGGIRLYVYAASDDGDFQSKGQLIVDLNSLLEITDIKNEYFIFYSHDYRNNLGTINGKTISTAQISDYKNFDGGDISCIMDYGDFYLVVSTNIVKKYKTPPWVNIDSWYYTETVYSAYNKNKTLIWRTSVDSTPNYEEYLTNN